MPGSLLAPPLPRAITRIEGTFRPFFNVIGAGGGGIIDLSLEHYFAVPLKVGAGMTPAAFTIQPNGGGSVAHLRIEAAYATDFIELGLAAGSRVENFGRGGFSLAGRLRLGALDGLSVRLTYGYALIRNRYTGQERVAFSNVLTTIQVPLRPGLALVVDAGFSFDVWIYAIVGLKHRVVGDGGPGTWMISAGAGVAWVLEGFPCQYADPSHCEGAAWGLGPTIAVGLDHRF